jgi:hypothetical protein
MGELCEQCRGRSTEVRPHVATRPGQSKPLPVPLYLCVVCAEELRDDGWSLAVA